MAINELAGDTTRHLKHAMDCRKLISYTKRKLLKARKYEESRFHYTLTEILSTYALIIYI